MRSKGQSGYLSHHPSRHQTLFGGVRAARSVPESQTQHPQHCGIIASAMLESKRLRYVPHEREDAAQSQKWHNSPDVKKFFLANPYHLPEPERAEKMWDHWMELIQGKWTAYKVEVKKTGKAIGVCGFGVEDSIGTVPGRYEIWLYIGETEELEKGYGTEITKTLVKALFEYHAAHIVLLAYHGFNHRGRRCYEKCGFRFDGRAREQSFWEGTWYDTEIRSITRPV